MHMTAIEINVVRGRKNLNGHREAIFDILKSALKKITNKKVIGWTYNPLPESERSLLKSLIDENFKSMEEFAYAAGLDLFELMFILNNKRCGNGLIWKKINNVLERYQIKLPVELKIKYEVDKKFGGK